MSETVVQEALAHFRLTPVGIASVEESYSSVVRILTLERGERLVLKIPFVQRKLFREVCALQELGGDLPVPRLVDHWIRDDESPGALLLSLLPGAPIRGRVSPALAFGLGSLLGTLHTHEVPDFGELLPAAEGPSPLWWPSLRRRFLSWQPLCAQVIPSHLIQRAEDRYAELSEGLPAPDGPCWVHFDYRPGNVLMQGSSITGLIDFESARGGSADLDFVKIQHEVWDPWPDTREPFLEGYRSIRPLPDIERTLPLYALCNAFGGVAWCVKRSRIEDPFFAENLNRLKQLL